MASKAAAKNGLVLLSLCRNASGIMVQPPSAATECEFEPVMETGPFTRTGSALDAKDRTEGNMRWTIKSS
ncbi:hypothetical protein DA102_033305 [Sinorhizobium meliloti]|nr:hypothetical protein DA102_033305 [Sinorhizobium meliloti]